jgi:hypothetical protein
MKSRSLNSQIERLMTERMKVEAEIADLERR